MHICVCSPKSPSSVGSCMSVSVGCLVTLKQPNSCSCMVSAELPLCTYSCSNSCLHTDCCRDFLGETGQAEPGLEPGDQIAALQRYIAMTIHVCAWTITTTHGSPRSLCCSLSTEQQTMCEFRSLLLKYFDRLSTYEVSAQWCWISQQWLTLCSCMQRILSHPECSLEFYDADFYKSFRNGNLLHYAVLFARVSLNVMEYKILCL